MDAYRLAIEFRKKSWFEGKHAEVTLAFERERNHVNAIVGEPQGHAEHDPFGLGGDQPRSGDRPPGRNHETWNKRGLTSSAERFNYDYSDDELPEFGGKIRGVPAARVHVVFNILKPIRDRCQNSDRYGGRLVAGIGGRILTLRIA